MEAPTCPCLQTWWLSATTQQGRACVVRCQHCPPPPGAGHMAAEIAAGRPVTPCCIIPWTWGLDSAVEVVLLTVVGCLDGAEETGVPRPSRVGELSALGASCGRGPLAPCGSGGQRGCWADEQVGSGLGSWRDGGQRPMGSGTFCH